MKYCVLIIANLLFIATLSGCGETAFQAKNLGSLAEPNTEPGDSQGPPNSDPGQPNPPGANPNPPPGPSPAPPPDLGIYDTFEVEAINRRSYSNPFDFKQITFSLKLKAPSGKDWKIDGFYDGDGKGKQSGNIWKARFMPNEQGTWSYQTLWSDGKEGESGQFEVGPQANPDNHGHVHRQGKFLIHDDGTSHHWYGGTWVRPEGYGPTSKSGQVNGRRITKAELLDYLDLMKQTGHNGLLLKTRLAPIEDNKISWDLSWIQRGEWFVREMAQRGIYVQINFFDTWSRKRGGYFTNGHLYYDTNGANQVFDVWRAGDENAKRNYIRTLVARFGSYYNVYWELGNEMEHTPNSMDSFASLADSKYIPWTRQADPYNLPIGVSETPTASRTKVDIVFHHQTNDLPGASVDRPTIMNELVRGGDTGPLYDDGVIRNPASRYSFRRTFWRMFTYGGSGSSEATWLNIKTPLNSAVRTVMKDHGKLRELVDSLGVQPHQMKVQKNWISNGPKGVDYGRTRFVPGQVYVTYFAGSGSHQKGELQVTSLPPGNYEVSFMDPKDLQVTMQHQISGGQNLRFDYPAFKKDLVLKIKKIQ